MAVIQTQFVGRHELRFQPPNRVYMTLHGMLDARGIGELNPVISKWRDQCGQRLGFICDLGDFEGMTADARRSTVQTKRDYFGIALVGGSFMTRTILSTVLRAGRRLAPERFKFPVYFGKTLTECEAWLDSVQP